MAVMFVTSGPRHAVGIEPGWEESGDSDLVTAGVSRMSADKSSLPDDLCREEALVLLECRPRGRAVVAAIDCDPLFGTLVGVIALDGGSHPQTGSAKRVAMAVVVSCVRPRRINDGILHAMAASDKRLGSSGKALGMNSSTLILGRYALVVQRVEGEGLLNLKTTCQRRKKRLDLLC